MNFRNELVLIQKRNYLILFDKTLFCGGKTQWKGL